MITISIIAKDFLLVSILFCFLDPQSIPYSGLQVACFPHGIFWCFWFSIIRQNQLSLIFSSASSPDLLIAYSSPCYHFQHFESFLIGFHHLKNSFDIFLPYWFLLFLLAWFNLVFTFTFFYLIYLLYEIIFDILYSSSYSKFFYKEVFPCLVVFLLVWSFFGVLFFTALIYFFLFHSPYFVPGNPVIAIVLLA